ncbi:MAG: hypothetical protein QF733_03395 [Phycisphaerales bacterium]|jgi:hypothetical protein|nr:hypothetical protein [Phycisphaerales bacterium]
MSHEHETISTSGDDDPALHTLLEIARSQETRPTVALLNRLKAADGLNWLCEALARDCDGNAVDAEALLCTPDGDVEFLRTQYGVAKQCFHGARNSEERLRGLLWYLLIMAAAAAHHDERLSSQPAGVISNALLELAPDLADPWGDLLASGALAID